jgi:putative hydrolase of the HAD superfamily
MTHAVLFDLDGTLFNRDAAVRRLVEEQHRQFAAELAHIPCATYVERVLELDAHGHRDKVAVYRQLAAEFDLAPMMAELLTRQFWTRYPAHSLLFAEVLGTLHALRAQGFQLGLITNGAVAVQESIIHGLGLAPLMDVILISEREGVRKPEPEIFRRALIALDVLPTRAWFVGDHPTVDVDAAAARGLHAIWRRNTVWGSPTGPHHVIDTLDEILSIIN